MKIISLWLIMMSTPLLGGTIAPLSEGLTLAQISQQGLLRTLLVLEDNGASIRAIDISTELGLYGDLAEVYAQIDYAALEALATNAQANISSYRYQQLLSPAGRGEHHLALGLNYRAHAAEVGASEQPFMFPKVLAATREQDIAINANILLDYEAELCLRPMAAISRVPAAIEPVIGVYLCGDFTDRARLLQQIDVADIQSGRGFSDAKSLPGYFPTGPYLVIPKNWRTFTQSVVFTLTLNNTIRQQAQGSERVWSLADIFIQLDLFNASSKTVYSSQVDSLIPANGMTPAVTILTGTPEGVLMQRPSVWEKMLAGLSYIFSGAFTDTEFMRYVAANMIDNARVHKTFLQAGDRNSYFGALSRQNGSEYSIDRARRLAVLTTISL